MLYDINKCIDTFYIAMTKPNFPWGQNKELISFGRYIQEKGNVSNPQ